MGKSHASQYANFGSLQKPLIKTQIVYMKYISYLEILNIVVRNCYTECCFLCQIVIFSSFG